MSETAKDKKIPDFLTCDGELGEMIRDFDWASTSLGPIESWSQSLKTTVNLMLHSKNPIWIGWGPEITFLYNDAYIDVLGIDKHGWALGKPAAVVWEEIWDFCGPMADKVFKEGATTNSNDAQLFMKRGTFLEETFFSFFYSPVYDEYGKVSGLFCPNFETTEKILNARRNRTLSELASKTLLEKNIEAAYASSAGTLTKNAEDIPFAMFYYADGNSTKARLIQRVHTGTKAENVFPAEFDMEGNCKFAEVVKEGKPCVIPIPNPEAFPKGQAGQPVTQAIALPLTMGAQKAAGLLLCGINPTRRLDIDYTTFFEMVAGQVSAAIQNATALENERKRLEELAELDRAKTAFFSNISHEFRTPLTLILGPLEDLLQNSTLQAEEKQSIETTHRNALRLLKLVNTLLDFSLMESGRMKAKFIPTDIAAFTESLAGNFRSITEKAGLDLVVNISTLGSKVYVDREMWEKIVFNLLSNAFKYTLKGTITISLFENGGHAVLEVRDTGVGIPAKEMPNMFLRFHRIRGSKGRSFEGTGIGLSMIKELINQHGGTIGVKSIEGEGTTFTITIPFGKKHLEASQVSYMEGEVLHSFSQSYLSEAGTIPNAKKEDTIEVAHEPVNNQETVLIVDDNVDMRVHLTSIVEKEYRTVTAENGHDALEKIRQNKPSLILSDIMMPVMDGIELLREIKSNIETSMIPVVLLTARAGEESRIEGYETGADDYLVKPFSSKELIARIRSQIRVSKVRDHARKQLHNIFMQAPMAICILRGKDFIVEMANNGILEMWSKTAETMINKPLFEGLPEAKEQDFDKLLTQVYTTGINHVDEECPFYKLENGIQKKIYIKFICQPFHEEEGNISGIVVVAHDVTPQVEARKKVEESEYKFRNLIRQAPMAISIINGRDLIFEVANDAYLKIHNKTREELLGHKFTEALPQFKGSSVEQNLFEVLDTGKSLSFTNRPIEIRAGGKPEIRYFNSIYQPLFTDNKVTGIVSVVHEVTEQYLAQKIKDKNEKDLKLILETMPHIAFRSRPDGNITYYNNRYYEYTGLTPEQAYGDGWKPAIHPDMLGEVTDKWMKAMATGTEYNDSFLLRRGSDGAYRWHMSRTVALRNEKGEITEWVGTLTDIHDQKVFANELEAIVNERTRALAEKNVELEQSNKELESFNYVASHDLQEPLRKIQTFISIIRDRKLQGSEAVNYMSKIYSSAGRMSQLIQDVLTYSRIAAEDQFTNVDLNAALENVLADYELLITEKNAVVNKGPLPTINAIHLQIHQLFSNLISNSLKYSKGKPVITISGKVYFDNKSQKMLELIFSDNGIGFEEQYSEQIFKLFQRLHGKSEFSGTGIGLSICKKIVEQHGGSIWATSAPGQGATFTINLPV